MPENHSPLLPLPFAAAAAVSATAAMNTMNGEDEDHFDRLPDALILVIFNKVLHAKYLGQCFAISKRFASLLPHTDTVFYSMRYRLNQNLMSVLFRNIVNLPLRILHRIVPILSQMPSSLSYCEVPAHAVVDMTKFTGVRSLRIEWCHQSNSDFKTYGGYLKSKAVIGARLEMAVFISTLVLDIPKLLRPFIRTNAPIDAISEVVGKYYLDSIKARLLAFLAHHQFVQTLIHRLPALCELVFDDKLVGKLCLGKDQIVQLRNSCIAGAGGLKSELSSAVEVIGGTGRVVVKMTVHPLELPSSGPVMKWAIVAVVKPQDDDEEIIVMERDVGLMLGACERDDDEDVDNGKANAIDEIVNVVRENIVSDPHGRSSIKTHRLNLVED